MLWADLATSTPESELESIAAAFGQAEAVAQRPDLPNKAEFVRQILANKRVLLVIDNAESEDQVRWLLPHGPDIRVLITTRNYRLLVSLDATVVKLESFTELEGVDYLKKTLGEERVQAEPEAAERLLSHRWSAAGPERRQWRHHCLRGLGPGGLRGVTP